MRKLNPVGCLLNAALVTALALAPVGAQAEPYPARPVRVIVPFPAGGGTDVIARSLAEELSRSLGKPFIVENKPGAGSVMGSDMASAPSPNRKLTVGSEW